MAKRTFGKIWYLPEENRWRDMNLLAMRDAGTLVVNDDSLVFNGKKEKVRITNIKEISYGKQGRDFVNNWVKIEYQDGMTAFFADGSWLGWRGIFGGTKKILNAVQHFKPDAMAKPEHVYDSLELSCSQCGKRFLKEDMIRYENVWVCASCKPVFIQKIKEGVSVRGIWEYAGFWLRLGAFLLDFTVTSIVLMVIYIPSFMIMARMKLLGSPSPDMPVVIPLLFSLPYMTILIAYETWFVGRYGATLGKMVCKIKVITSDGSRVSYFIAFLRYCTKVISGSIFFIGYIIAAFDDQKRALHDRMCDTRVIK